MNDLIVLASNGADFFTATDLGKALASMMKAAALIIVLVAAVRAVKHVLDGKGGKAAQLIIGTAVVVAFLWDPTLIGKLIDLASSLVGDGVNSVNDTTSGGGATAR